jgi:hypothetical protein
MSTLVPFLPLLISALLPAFISIDILCFMATAAFITRKNVEWTTLNYILRAFILWANYKWSEFFIEIFRENVKVWRFLSGLTFKMRFRVMLDRFKFFKGDKILHIKFFKEKIKNFNLIVKKLKMSGNFFGFNNFFLS